MTTVMTGIVNAIKVGEYKNPQGDTVKTVEWLLSVPQKREVDGYKNITVKVTHFGKSAETHEKYVSKGNVVTVCGDLGVNTWLDKSTGEPRAMLVLYPDGVNYFPNGKKSDSVETVSEPEEDEIEIV